MLGGDQGGCIRVPAAWSGIVGHKSTYGLVPYTGVVGLVLTIDRIGPVTRPLEDAGALLLPVIAGKYLDDAVGQSEIRLHRGFVWRHEEA